MVKYTKEERLEIGRRIYNRELSVYDAAAEYDINWYTARDYMREYRDLNNLDPMKRGPIGTSAITNQKKKYSDLETLSSPFPLSMLSIPPAMLTCWPWPGR